MRSRLTLLAVLLTWPVQLSAQTDARALRERLRLWRERNEVRLVRELAEFLAIPNLASDSAAIRRNAAWLAQALERRGVQAQLLETDGAPPAVLGRLTVPGATRTVVLYAHYDGQPVDASEWRSGPWTPTLRSGPLDRSPRDLPLVPVRGRYDPEWRLFARSAGDDKSPIVAALAALDALRDQGMSPTVNLTFFFEGEEERSSPHLRQTLTRHAALLRADAWIFLDGPVHQSRRHQLVLGVRGVAGFQLTVYGPRRALHSGHYGNWAPNPALLLAHLVASMRDADGRIMIPDFYSDVRPITSAERAALAALPDVDAALRAELGLAATEASNAPNAERILLPALNVQGLSAGRTGEQSANAIQPEATASFDFRLVPDQTPDRLRRLLVAHLEGQGYHVVEAEPDSATRARYPRIVRLQWRGGYPATRIAPDHPAVRAVAAAVQPALDQPLLLLPTSGGSLPMHHFAEVLGAPLITFPLVNHDNNQHAANENLRLANLWDAVELLGVLMVRLGATWRPEG